MGLSAKQPVTPTKQSPLSSLESKVSQGCREIGNEINVSKVPALWCILNKAAGQAMRAASIKGEVMECPSSLTYLRIHFDT